MKKIERNEGYYWVRIGEQWRIAFWKYGLVDNYWQTHWCKFALKDDYFDEISYMIMPVGNYNENL